MIEQAVPDTARVMVDFTQMKSFGQDPLILERGEGIRVTDVFGKTYIDGLSGVFTVNLGHGIAGVGRRRRRAGAQDRLHRADDGHQPAGAEARGVAHRHHARRSTRTVKFFSGGSEATEAAIKLARQFWMQAGHPRKYKVISRYRSYHGGTGHAMAASAQTAWKWKFEPFAPGFIHVTPPARPGCAACRRADDCTLACLDLMEQAIVEEHPETVAAVIAEPVMLSAGVHVPHPEYFPRLREMCDSHDVLLIYDEIITGFGRTGRLFGAERVGAWPDILSCGKGISGGYAPLSAILIADRWFRRPSGASRRRGCSSGPGIPSAATRSPAPWARRRCATCSTTTSSATPNGSGTIWPSHLRDSAPRQPAIAEVRGIGMLRGVAFTSRSGRRSTTPRGGGVS